MKANKYVFWALIMLIVVYSLAPFVWQAITSVKPQSETFKIPPTYIPKKLTSKNYTAIFTTRPFATYIVNSIIVASLSTLLAVASGAFAAYGLARLNLSGGATILKLILVAALFPPIILVVPLYEMIRLFHLMNNPLALIFPYAAINLPFVVWVLYSFFRQVPQDLEDAARVDGFSNLGILLKIIAPLSAPALATTMILVFIFAWNEFLFALTFMTRDSARTVPVGIAMLKGATVYEIPWGQISAAIVITTLPVVVVVIFLQRRIIQGLSAGAIKA